MQAQVARSLLEPEGQHGNGFSTPSRMKVYRNNVAVSLIRCLEARYPAVAAILGVERFRGFAHAFVLEAPPHTPVLLEYGRRFPEFLEDSGAATAEPCVGDVARLEWSLHDAYHAEDASVVEAGAIARHLANADDLVFAFAPSAALVRSTYPIFSLWKARTSARSDHASLATFEGPEDVLVTRPHLVAELVKLPRGGAELISALLAGRALNSAVDAAFDVNAAFPLAEMLALLIRQGAITSVLCASDSDRRFVNAQTPSGAR